LPTEYTHIRNEAALDKILEREHVIECLSGDTASNRAVRLLLIRVGRQNPKDWNQWPDGLHEAKIWETSKDEEIITWLKHIYNRVYTSNSHGHPLKSDLPNNCVCNTGIDSAAHMRGACAHPYMLAHRLDRHDRMTELIASAALNADRGGRHIAVDYGKTCAITDISRGTIHPNLKEGCPPYSGGQPDICITNNRDTTLPDLTATDEIKTNVAYYLSILDPLVVADEKHMDEAITTKTEKNQEMIDSLGTRHNVSFNPIAIGSRIPLLNNESIRDLHLNPEQLKKLQSRIWHNIIADLHTMHKTYNSIQGLHTPKKSRRAAAIPRKKRSIAKP
jgi:hypothetical protein